MPYNKEYHQAYELKHRDRRNAWRRNRKRTNPNYRLKCCLRTRIWKALKGVNKSASTIKLIGCTPKKLWQHLEKQFQLGMTWENYGKWHVDHIIPCSSFDFTDPEQQKKCFYYTNLQPLWACDNLSKGKKVNIASKVMGEELKDWI